MPFSGYTIFQAKEVGALLIDMNGGEVQLWKEFHGMPNRILPGGYLIGNTMITKSSGGRIFEATPEHEIVWEYISPCWGQKMKINMICRAYRVPYHPKENPKLHPGR